jgi:hypothetical protein
MAGSRPSLITGQWLWGDGSLQSIEQTVENDVLGGAGNAIGDPPNEAVKG